MPNAGKRGLCWPVETHDALLPFTRPGSKVTWLYNWSPRPHLPGLGTSIEWVPMQWNAVGIEHLAELCQNPPSPPPPAAASSASSAPHPPPLPNRPLPPARALLAFNEPERADQASMDVDAAADAWMAHIEPLRRRGLVRAGSPGIASTEEGIGWLQRFVALVRARGGDVDFWALHWYGGAADLGGFYDYLWSARARLDEALGASGGGGTRPVWVTEYACTTWDAARPADKAAVERFCRESAAYLDSLDWVERYAWFGAMRDTGNVGKWAALLDEKGGISDLGRIYRDC